MFQNKAFDYQTFQDNLGVATESSVDVEEFDDLLELVGSNGKYQKWLLYGFLCPFLFLLPVAYGNTIFLFSEPDHWCHLPISDSAARDIWIPKEVGSDGSQRLSQCLMYVSPLNHAEIPCVAGWDYDKTNFDATIPTDLDWVCNKEDYVTKALISANLGSGPGALVIGWAGDRFGRKPTFFAATFIMTFFKTASLFVTSHFHLFLVLQFVMGTAYPAIMFCSISLAMESVGKDMRSWVSSCRFVTWVLGLCILPILAMVTRHWLNFGLLTPLPLLFTFLSFGFLLESPRWLLIRGEMTAAENVLLKMAKANKTDFIFDSCDLLGILMKMKVKLDQKKNMNPSGHAFLDLFSKWRLTKNTVLICFTTSITYMLLYGINYGVTSLPGNQFYNFLVLAAIEIPVGWIGYLLADNAGRRWTQVLAFGVGAVAFACVAYVTLANRVSAILIPTLVLAKCAMAVSSIIVPLQAVELFPTTLRSNGVGLMSASIGLTSVLVPLILYLGKTRICFPYYVFAALSLLGMLATIFLPETLGQSLPETVEDALLIGSGTPFWSFLPHDYKTLRIDYSADAEENAPCRQYVTGIDEAQERPNWGTRIDES